MIKDSIIYFISKFIPAIVTMLNVIIFMKFMDTEDYGRYSVILVTSGIINVFTTQWIRSSMLKFTKNLEDEKFFSVLEIYIILFTSFLIIIIGNIINFSFVIITSLLILQILISINEFQNNYFRYKLMPNVILISNLIKSSSFLIMLITSAYVNDSISFSSAIMFYSFSLVLSSLYYFTKYDSYKFTKSLNVSKTRVVKCLSYGFPITLAFSVGIALQNIDKYLITGLLGIKETGNYSLPFDTLHNFIYMVMSALGTAALPRLLKIEKKIEMKKSFEKYILAFYLINIPIICLLITNLPFIAYVFSKNGYNVNELTLFFILISSFAHGTKSFIYDQAIQLNNRTAKIFLPNILAIIINILINLIFLQKYGIIVAAISSFLAFGVSNIITYIYILKDSNIKFLSKDIIHIIIINVLIIFILLNINIDYTVDLIISLLLLLFINLIIYKSKWRIVK